MIKELGIKNLGEYFTIHTELIYQGEDIPRQVIFPALFVGKDELGGQPLYKFSIRGGAVYSTTDLNEVTEYEPCTQHWYIAKKVSVCECVYCGKKPETHEKS